jgi:hypothetical protein
MARQSFGGLTFERPSQWKERPALAYDVPGLSFGEASSKLLVTTEAREPSDTLVGHVRRHAERMGRELHTTSIDVACVLVGEQPGVRLRVERDGEHGPVVETRAYLANPMTIDEVLVFTFVSGIAGPCPTASRVIDTLLASIRVPLDPPSSSPDLDEEDPVTLPRPRLARLRAV